jgi:hypothetical protein
VDELIETLIEKLQDTVKQNVIQAISRMNSNHIKTPQIKNLRRHRSYYMNSERMSTNTKVK